MVQITVRAGRDLNGNYRPEISGYLPYSGPKPESLDDDEGDDDDDIDFGDDDDDEIEDDDEDEFGDEDDDAEDVVESVSRAPF